MISEMIENYIDNAQWGQWGKKSLINKENKELNSHTHTHTHTHRNPSTGTLGNIPELKAINMKIGI